MPDQRFVIPQLTVTVVEGEAAGTTFAMKRAIRIGRNPESDLVLFDSEVSSNHAAIAPNGLAIELKDLGSTNGTFVNGERVDAVRRLNSGDEIKIGATVLKVQAPTPADNASVAPPGLQVTRVRQIPIVPVLSFIAGQLAGTTVPVGGPIVVGRDPETADVMLDTDTDVSRSHATFSPSGGGLTVQDLGSTNGTFVNDQRITGTVALSDGDQVRIGDSVMEVQIAGPREIEPVAPTPVRVPGQTPNGIEVSGLVKQFGDYRAVNGINLSVSPGEIYGFLGPNGAGKSTTVHMLTTLLPPTGGTARIAGLDVVKDGARVRATIGVALQAAALDPALNAWEHMDLQMALQGIPGSERRKRRVELVERVGLAYAADRRVGGYSGGMKRRLDLALALVHRPRVLFLDEPTTGLDPQSRTALWEEVDRLVKQEGMTVFLTTQYLEEADVLADRVGIIDRGEIVAEDTPARLKAEIGRPTVEVSPEDGSQSGAISVVLERFGELVSAAHRGIAVRLAPGVEGLADVVRALDAAGLRIANFELHAPSLDDVFLIKTGRSLEGGGGESADAGAVTE